MTDSGADVNLSARLRRRLRYETGLLAEQLVRPLVGDRPPSSAVLLVGSGRSGTTWIADAVAMAGGAQQIFEPLHPNAVPEARVLAGWREQPWTLVRSHYLSPTEAHPEWRDFLGRVLQGRLRNYWTDQVRTSWFPRIYLIKSIRANLMLRFIHENFRPRFVLMRRHPCAVVASRLRIPWQADVRDILSQDRLVEEHLRPWVGDIERETDQLGAHAVWWAVENFISTRDLSNIPHCQIYYERACIDPLDQARDLCSWLEIESAVDMSKLRESSRMTLGGGRSMEERLGAWRSQLDAKDSRRILRWADAFGLSWYSEDLLPVV